MSVHPTTTDAEVAYVCDSIKELAANFESWAEDYAYDARTNEFLHKSFRSKEKDLVNKWFNIET